MDRQIILSELKPYGNHIIILMLSNKPLNLCNHALHIPVSVGMFYQILNSAR